MNLSCVSTAPPLPESTRNCRPPPLPPDRRPRAPGTFAAPRFPFASTRQPLSSPRVANCGNCGSAQLLEDGGEARCLGCGAVVPAASTRPAGSVFERDKFLLQQQYLTIHNKYDVCDLQGHPIAYVVRPYHARSLAALLAAFVTAAAILGAAFLLMRSLGGGAQDAVLIPACLLGFVAFIFVAYALAPKRHVTVWGDAAGRVVLLRVLQDGRFQFPTATYTVQTPDGQTIARLAHGRLFNPSRRWACAQRGLPSCVAEEDSPFLAVLGRLIRIRTRVVILEQKTRTKLGELDHRSTILNRYVLDLTADRRGLLDRRAALALAVILDSDKPAPVSSLLRLTGSR